jgi:adenine-specific DNA-methyltransferase
MTKVKIPLDSDAESRQETSLNILNSNSSLRNIAYWESKLFSSVYLRNDLKRDFAEKWTSEFNDQVYDEEGNSVKRGFFHFYNEFRNIANSLRGLSQKNLSETDTITKIIVPLLDALGWYDNCSNNVEEPYAAETSFTVAAKPKNKTFRTDMILVDHPQEAGFVSDPKDNEKRKKEARQYCIVPLEAKYWNRIVEREKSNLKEDRKRANKESDDTGASASFNEQVLNYMEILHKSWGIVTDGNIWRLLNREISSEAPERCFEFKIEALLDQEAKIESGITDDFEFMENAKYFYLFFGKASFLKDEVGKVFVDEVLKESRKYIDSIEEDLKDRFISAMNVTCDGLLKAAQRNGEIQSPTEADLKLIRTVAESHLFNILFIKSCEARSVLPIKSPNYYNLSLTGIIDRISVFEPEKYTTKTEKDYLDKKLESSLKIHKYSPQGFNLYKNLVRLTEVIHEGASQESYGFEIKGFKESVFSKEEWSFAKRNMLTDEEMVRILFELGYSKASLSLQRNYQQIPYNYFTPRQLGSIYESFLEYKLDVATEPMVYIKKGKYKQWTKLTASIQSGLEGYEPIVRHGQAFFTPDNSERKSTGSYYTPDFIVQYIVKEALGPLCEGKDSSEILSLKICDPAMGSGHFLIAALNFVTSYYLAALEKELPDEQVPSREEAKRRVLDSCIFGVDINSRAVKLSKMSLWLEGAHWGRKLERLDDQIVIANSLTVEVIWPEYPDLMKGGFSAIIGNPPYIGERGKEKIFHPVQKSDLGRRFYARWMDYFYYFIHRALDLVEVGGRIGMITTNYYFVNAGAIKLRADIKKRAVYSTIIDFNEMKIFESATGQHNAISILEKGSDITAITKLIKFVGAGKCTDKIFNDIFDSNQTGAAQFATRSNESLYRGEDSEIQLDFEQAEGKGPSGIEGILDSIEADSSKLGDLCKVLMGLVTRSDKVSKAHFKIDKNLKAKKGDGIFVISDKELKALDLDQKDAEKYIRPFFKNSDVDHFATTKKNKSWLIYMADTGRTISLSKKMKAHFDKFENLLISLKRNFLKNEIAAPFVKKWLEQGNWFVMFNPKKEKYFTGEKIVAPYRSRLNTFAFDRRHFFGSQDLCYILKGKKEINLKYVTGILNSKLIFAWYYCRGKRKGDILEICKKPVSNIPIRMGDPDITKRLQSCVDRIISAGYSEQNALELNNIVYELYGVDKKSQKIIEDFYQSKVSRQSSKVA